MIVRSVSNSSGRHHLVAFIAGFKRGQNLWACGHVLGYPIGVSDVLGSTCPRSLDWARGSGQVSHRGRVQVTI
jgi:hypothetical protein